MLKCFLCQRRVRHYPQKRGKAIIVDYEPTERGNVSVDEFAVARRVAGGGNYMEHVSTCPMTENGPVIRHNADAL